MVQIILSMVHATFVRIIFYYEINVVRRQDVNVIKIEVRLPFTDWLFYGFLCISVFCIIFWQCQIGNRPPMIAPCALVGRLYPPIPQRAAPPPVHLLLLIQLKALIVTLTLTRNRSPVQTLMLVAENYTLHETPQKKSSISYFFVGICDSGWPNPY